MCLSQSGTLFSFFYVWLLISDAYYLQISHRQGLLRVCEFTLAEIEHFVDPGNKSHPKFSDVANFEFLMFPREEQMSGQSAKKLCLGEVVAKVSICNHLRLLTSSMHSLRPFVS